MPCYLQRVTLIRLRGYQSLRWRSQRFEDVSSKNLKVINIVYELNKAFTYQISLP